jgi:thioredoxin 1
MSNNIVEVTEATYEQEVLNSPVPVIVDFWAPWCGPCLALMPALEAMADEYAGRLKIAKINADDNVALCDKFGVRGIPQLFLVKQGAATVPVRGRTRTRLQVEIDDLLA